MSFFEFPHTRTYDSDLGWLIKDYKTLDESKFFYPLAEFGAEICPELKQIEQQMMEWTLNMAAKYGRE
jgi:hypothetical protein